MLIGSSTPLRDCSFIQSKTLNALLPLGFETVGDVLRHPPKRYENRKLFDHISHDIESTPLCLQVRVLSGQWKKSGAYRRYYEILVEDVASPFLTQIACRWFNFPGIGKIIISGMTLILYGRIKRMGATLSMIHPDFELIEDIDQSEDSLHFNRLVPIYRGTGGLPQKRYRELVYDLLARLPDHPDTPTVQRNLYPSLRKLHFPEREEDSKEARRYFSMEECFLQQLGILHRRANRQELSGLKTASTTALVKDLADSLPFSLTESQKSCIREIYRDMKSPRPMNRLLQGDVGSGKTLVALCAALMAIESGYQVAFMAPTQILAEQHFATASKLLAPLDIKILLKTSDKVEQTQGWGQALRPQLVIGTHALLYDDTLFEHLGLVIIDEQHKFGVRQRQSLIDKGANPDVLVMTATPIPRTLTLTLYGDLDLSLLTEKPLNRGKIVTAVRNQKEKDLKPIVKFLREEIDKGHQIFVVAPLIEKRESPPDEDLIPPPRSKKKPSTSSALSELEAWKKRLPNIDIGLVHGKMSADEKESVMNEFRLNRYSVLVSTTVIEVGVDIPNATVMLIHNADQFGLSQLHQLRGRIGRGEHASYCILLTPLKDGEENFDKLKRFEIIQDGFELAELDFQLRGPGEVFGAAQSGLSSINFPEWLSDGDILKNARTKAERILKLDPSLSLAEHADFRTALERDPQWNEDFLSN